MWTRLKAAVAAAYSVAGGLRRLHAGRLVVLIFHRVRPDEEPSAQRPMRNLEVRRSDFRRMLEWLRGRYEPVALADVLRQPRSPSAPPAFAVTFDDGWADNYEWAYPVLKELAIPATIFLATAAVEEGRPFWWQQLDLPDAEIERLKNRPPAELEAMNPAGAVRREDFLTWGQIQEMGRSGLVRFGPHGHRHARLTCLAREEALADIRQSVELLRKHAAAAWLPALAWPNGDARGDLAANLEALGLLAAFGTRRGAIGSPWRTRWDLPRNNVDRQLAGEPSLWPWLLLRAWR